MSVPGFPWRQEPAPLATRNLADRRLLLSYHRTACPVAASDLMGPAVTFSSPQHWRGRAQGAASVGLPWTGVCPWPTCGRGSHILLLGSTCQVAKEVSQADTLCGLPTSPRPTEQRVPRSGCRGLAGHGLAGLPRAALKNTLSSGSVEQTFIEHLSARHCARCHGKYKE